jgi:hypothetical protein
MLVIHVPHNSAQICIGLVKLVTGSDNGIETGNVKDISLLRVYSSSYTNVISPPLSS